MRSITLLFFCYLSVLPALAQEIDVFIIGGQSNATGQGYIKNIPACFQTDTTVLFYYSHFLNEGKGGGVWQPLCQASETKDKFGLELSMGTKLQELFPKQEIALIKHALSGSNLYEQWNPGNRTGEEYSNLKLTVNQALTKLKENGYIPIIRAMVWQQGEADARDIAGIGKSFQYGVNLKNFIEQIRKEFNSEDMLFIYVSVMPMVAERFTGRDIIRLAQVWTRATTA